MKKSLDTTNRQSENRNRASDPQPHEDDRFPGSFFRIPGVPRPGKTGWSAS